MTDHTPNPSGASHSRERLDERKGRVLTGNAGMECEWVPTHVTPGMAPLPIYPNQSDMPEVSP